MKKIIELEVFLLGIMTFILISIYALAEKPAFLKLLSFLSGLF